MKSHLAMSSDPIDFSRDLPMKVMCNKTLDHPRAEMMVEISRRGLPDFNPLRDCMECVDAAEKAVRTVEKQYLYAVINGQEAFERFHE